MPSSKEKIQGGMAPSLSTAISKLGGKGSIVDYGQAIKSLAEANQGQGKLDDSISAFPLLSERSLILIQELLKVISNPDSAGKTRRYAYFLLTDAVAVGCSGAPRPYQSAEDGQRSSFLSPGDWMAAARLLIEALVPRGIAASGVAPEEQSLVLLLLVALWKGLAEGAQRDPSLNNALGQADEALALVLEHQAAKVRQFFTSTVASKGGLMGQRRARAEASQREAVALVHLQAVLEACRMLPWGAANVPQTAWRGAVDRILDNELPRALSIEDPALARDALALLVARMKVGSPAAFSLAFKAVADTLATVALPHEATGEAKKEKALCLNLQEPEARVFLAHACCLGATHAEATPETREVFFHCLAVVAAHDASPWPSLEAARALFGDFAGEEDVPIQGKVDRCTRAWQLFSENVADGFLVPAAASALKKKDKKKKEGAEALKDLPLLDSLVVRLQSAVMTGRAPLLLAACKVARAAGRAWSAYTLSGAPSPPSDAVFLRRMEEVVAAAATRAATPFERAEALGALLLTAETLVEQPVAGQLVSLLKDVAASDARGGVGETVARRVILDLAETATLRPHLAPALVNLAHLYVLARAPSFARAEARAPLTAFWEALSDSSSVLANRVSIFSASVCLRLGIKAASPISISLVPNASLLLEEGLLLHPAAVARAAGADPLTRAILLTLSGQETVLESNFSDPAALLDQDARPALAAACSLTPLVPSGSWAALFPGGSAPSPAALTRGLRGLAAAAAEFLGQTANFASGEYVWTYEDAALAADRLRDTGHAQEAAVAARDLHRTLAPLRVELVQGLQATVPVINRCPALCGAAALLMAATGGLCRGAATAAVRSLGVIAVRSGEPLRSFLCGFLAQLSGRSVNASELQLLGLATEAELFLQGLDVLQAAKTTFKKVLEEVGPDPAAVAQDILESLFVRHCQLLALVKGLAIFMPHQEYYPLGTASRPFIERWQKATGADPRKYKSGGGFISGAERASFVAPETRTAFDAFDTTLDHMSSSSDDDENGLPLLVSNLPLAAEEEDVNSYAHGYGDATSLDDPHQGSGAKNKRPSPSPVVDFDRALDSPRSRVTGASMPSPAPSRVPSGIPDRGDPLMASQALSGFGLTGQLAEILGQWDDEGASRKGRASSPSLPEVPEASGELPWPVAPPAPVAAAAPSVASSSGDHLVADEPTLAYDPEVEGEPAGPAAFPVPVAVQGEFSEAESFAWDDILGAEEEPAPASEQAPALAAVREVAVAASPVLEIPSSIHAAGREDDVDDAASEVASSASAPGSKPLPPPPPPALEEDLIVDEDNPFGDGADLAEMDSVSLVESDVAPSPAASESRSAAEVVEAPVPVQPAVDPEAQRRWEEAQAREILKAKEEARERMVARMAAASTPPPPPAAVPEPAMIPAAEDEPQPPPPPPPPMPLAPTELPPSLQPEPSDASSDALSFLDDQEDVGEDPAPAPAPESDHDRDHVISEITPVAPSPVVDELPGLVPQPEGPAPVQPAAAAGPLSSMLYPFVAEAEGELSAEEGEPVRILSEDNEGWTHVQLVASGAVGLVPTSYLDL